MENKYWYKLEKVHWDIFLLHNGFSYKYTNNQDKK